jgi:hypothetical protein
LIQIKAAASALCRACFFQAELAPLLKTYTFYIRDGSDGPAVFEPLMCRSNDEIVAKALALLDRYPASRSIEVYFGDTELLRVKRPGPLEPGAP